MNDVFQSSYNNMISNRLKSYKTRFTFEIGEDGGPRQDEMGYMYNLLKKKEQEVIKMMFAIFIGFCVTYLPSFITTMVSLVFERHYQFLRTRII